MGLFAAGDSIRPGARIPVISRMPFLEYRYFSLDNKWTSGAKCRPLRVKEILSAKSPAPELPSWRFP